MSEPKPSIIEGEEPDPLEDITFYVSTYGGSADDMFSIYDVMNFAKSRCDVSTVGLGKVMSAGVLLLAAGTKGKRKIGKNCRVMIHAVSSGNVGTIHNLVNELGEIQNLQEAYIDAIVENSNFTKRTLKKLMDRKVNVYLSAEEAIEYGIADEFDLIIVSKRIQKWIKYSTMSPPLLNLGGPPIGLGPLILTRSCSKRLKSSNENMA